MVIGVSCDTLLQRPEKLALLISSSVLRHDIHETTWPRTKRHNSKIMTSITAKQSELSTKE